MNDLSATITSSAEESQVGHPHDPDLDGVHVLVDRRELLGLRRLIAHEMSRYEERPRSDGPWLNPHLLLKADERFRALRHLDRHWHLDPEVDLGLPKVRAQLRQLGLTNMADQLRWQGLEVRVMDLEYHGAGVDYVLRPPLGMDRPPLYVETKNTLMAALRPNWKDQIERQLDRVAALGGAHLLVVAWADDETYMRRLFDRGGHDYDGYLAQLREFRRRTKVRRLHMPVEVYRAPKRGDPDLLANYNEKQRLIANYLVGEWRRRFLSEAAPSP